MKLPQAWITAGTGTTQKPTATETKAYSVSPPKQKVSARIDMSPEVAGAGLCPDCKGQMTRVIANGIPTNTCHADRISIPVADSVLAAEAEARGHSVTSIFGPSTAEIIGAGR